MKPRFLYALPILLLFPVVAFAQESGKVQGIITDQSTGAAVPGATVQARLSGDAPGRLDRGAATNERGEFIITGLAPGEYLVSIRSIGYRTMEQRIRVTAGEPAGLTAALTPSVVSGSEVVVTGQAAATERRRLTTSVETITARQIEQAPVQTLDQLLQGRVSGMTSFSTSGMPGTGARIATRGIKSARGNSTPAIYVDGVRVDAADNFRFDPGSSSGGAVSSAVADIVVGEIERVEIVKGGAASTLYGTEAANGIIQIFTKKGVPGTTRVTASVVAGADVPETRFFSEDYTKDRFLQTGRFQQYSLNLGGGAEIASFNISARATGNTGQVTGNQLAQRLYSVTGGMRSQLSEQIDVEFSSIYSYNQFGRIFNNSAEEGALLALETEAANSTSPLFPGYTPEQRDSVFALYLLPELGEEVNRFTGSFGLGYLPLPEWTNRLTVGIDSRRSEYRVFGPLAAQNILFPPGAGGYIARTDRNLLTFTFGLTSSYRLVGEELTQTFTAGAQGFRYDDNESLLRGEGFVISVRDVDETGKIIGGESARELFNGGVFVNYGAELWDRIFLDAGIRVDGNTAFGSKVSAQAFPKAGLAWIASDEAFYPEALKSVVNFVKLRGSYGETGNYPSPNERDRQFVISSYNDQPALNFGNAGNPDLASERTASYEAGVELALFSDRVSLGFDYFHQMTTGALFARPNDPAAGGNGAQTFNTGSIRNRGIEVALRAIAVDSENLRLGLRIAIATLDNEVTSLNGSAPFRIGGFSYYPQRVEQGYPIGVFQATVPNLVPGSDGRVTPEVTAGVLMGNPVPTMTGSFGFDATIFKDLQIAAFAEFATGHETINQYFSRRFVNAVQARGVDSATGRATYPLYPEAVEMIPRDSMNNLVYSSRDQITSLFLEDASWLRLREVSIRYRLPEIITSYRGLVLTASVRNLLIITNANVDPEISMNRVPGNVPDLGGVGGIAISPAKSFRFGIEAGF